MGSISACAKLGVESLSEVVFSVDEQPNKSPVNPTMKPEARRNEESVKLNLCTKNPQGERRRHKTWQPF